MTDTDIMTATTTEGEIELSLGRDTICNIIALAREFDVKSPPTDPSTSATDDDDIALAVLEDRPSDPVEEELRSVLDDLSDDAQLDLVVLTWLGREDYTPDDWPALRRTAAEEHTAPTTDYLLGTPLLSDYLSAGMALLGYDCEAEFSRRG